MNAMNNFSVEEEGSEKTFCEKPAIRTSSNKQDQISTLPPVPKKKSGEYSPSKSKKESSFQPILAKM